MSHEVQTFLNTWDEESKNTIALLQALPSGQYDFRPDAGGRSVGELAWHLAEIEAYTGFGLERGAFEMGVKPPGFERPKTVEEIASGYERIHQEAMGKVAKLTPADLDRKLLFFTGEELPIRQILWAALLHHHIHHRGQLSVLCRLAGGVAPAPYGPNREQSAAMREKMAAKG
jgi:uncharacterized damage-inducible protein DinB